MQGVKWPADVHETALALIAHVRLVRPEATQIAVCEEVAERMDPAPSVHTLTLWGTRAGLWGGPPNMRVVQRYLRSVDAEQDPADEAAAEAADSAADGAAAVAVDEFEATLSFGGDATWLQEKFFELRCELRAYGRRAAGPDEIEVLRAADEHLLAAEQALRALTE